MDKRDQILARYRWAPGDCFRCARTNVDTTRLDEIDTPLGDQYEIRACRACVLDLEEEGRRRAGRAGREYIPGRLGRRDT